MLIDGHWIAIKDGDPRAVALYNRHYSARMLRDRHLDRVRYGFSGNGASMILITEDCTALFCWRYQDKYHKDGQTGVNCSVFRNEGSTLSSDLVREADELAWVRWPDIDRHYTYVDANKIKSSHPGYCFLKAGWDYQRDDFGSPIVSSGGLNILEIFKPTVRLN